MALQDIAWTVILYASVGKSPNVNNVYCAMVVTNVFGNYLCFALFFHRIWMCVYKSLLQNSFGALNMWDIPSIHTLRSSTALSSFWVKHRYTLGNSIVMSVVWASFWLLTGSLELWYALSVSWYFPPDVFPTFDIINITVSSCMVGFGLLMLAVQTFFTVSDSFNICTELTMKCFVIMFFVIYAEILTHTNLIAHGAQDDKWTWFLVVMSGEILLQILIADYHLYVSSRSSGKSRSNRFTIDLNMVLKDENLFTKFEKQLKREFILENLNFLVSCIYFRRTVMRQGHFGIGTSFTESEGEIFNMLNWRETMVDEDKDASKIARFIWSEFCVRGARQEINLNNQTVKRLSGRMKNLSNVYNYAERDLFDEAFDLIYDQLDNNSVLRFKGRLNLHSGTTCNVESIYGDGYGMPLLAKRAQ